MAERLLKKGDGAARTAKVAAKEKVAAKTEKVAAKGDDAARQIVLVATYKERQLAWIKKNGVYNYPAKDGDEFDADAFAKIKELWLYADAKGRRHCFAAEFAGKMTRDEFIAAYPSYAKLGMSRSKAYYVFKTSFLAYGPSLENPDVLTRAADFGGRSAKVKKAIAAFKADGAFGSLADYLPSDLSQIPHDHLCVCEAAVQLDFYSSLGHSTVDAGVEIDFFRDTASKTIQDELHLHDIPSSTGFTHVDCFSGVGGFCTGLHAAGFRTLVAIEKIKSCVETYQANHPEVHVVNNDICKVRGDEILPFCPADGVDLVTSGMPCETFSTAGNTSRSFYDERQFLFREGIRVAQMTHAKFLLFENVPAITTKTVSKTSSDLIVDVLKDELVKAGYRNYIEVVLDSTKFGVPQKRKRYFVLGTRLSGVSLRRPLSNLAKPFTVHDAFLDLPPVAPNTWQEGTVYKHESSAFTELMRDDGFWRRERFKTQGVTYQMPMKHRPATLERFSLLHSGEGLRDLFNRYTGAEREVLQRRRVLPRKMFIKRNFRLPVDSPSPTVTSHCLDEFVHPTENRALTVRECARLQSFPDSYDFRGGPYIVPHIDRDVQDKYEQIGDAVPPLLAYAWGRVISEMLMEKAK